MLLLEIFHSVLMRINYKRPLRDAERFYELESLKEMMDRAEDLDLLILVRLSLPELLLISQERESMEERSMLITLFLETRERIRITEEVINKEETEVVSKVEIEEVKDRILISKERLLIFNKVLIIFILFLSHFCYIKEIYIDNNICI